MREPNFLRGKNKASYTLFNTYYFYLACYVDILGDFCGRDSELSWCINEVGVYLPELYWWPQAHIIFPFLVFNTVRIYQHSGVIAVVENLEVFFAKYYYGRQRWCPSGSVQNAKTGVMITPRTDPHVLQKQFSLLTVPKL